MSDNQFSEGRLITRVCRKCGEVSVLETRSDMKPCMECGQAAYGGFSAVCNGKKNEFMAHPFGVMTIQDERSYAEA